MSEKVKFNLLLKSPDAKGHFSSNDLADVMTSSMIIEDVFNSYGPRYAKLGVDMRATHGDESTSNGDYIDYSKDHTWFSMFHTVVVFCVAVGNGVVTYRGIARGKKLASYQVVYQAVSPDKEAVRLPSKSDAVAPAVTMAQLPGKEPIELKDTKSASKDAFDFDEFNKELNVTLKSKKELSKRYKKIAVEQMSDPSQNGWTVEMEKETVETPPFWAVWRDGWTPPWIVKKAAVVGDTTSNMLGLTSYSYWLLFISAAVIAGSFGLSAVGIPDLVAFGLPLLFGTTYVGLKLKNQYKNRDMKHQEQDDFNSLTAETLLRMEEKKALGADYKEPAPAKAPSIPLTTTLAANTAIIAGVGSYIGWQYNMWFVTDFISTVGKFAVESAFEAIGIGIFVVGALALARGCYNAYQDYKKAHNGKAGFEVGATIVGEALLGVATLGLFPLIRAIQHDFATVPRKSFADHFKLGSTVILEKRDADVRELEFEVRRLEKKLPAGQTALTPVLEARLKQYRQEDEDAKANWFDSMKRNTAAQNLRNFFHVANFGMSGVYLTRTVLVRGATAFLLPGLAAVACLSNPITIGIMVAVGVVWGLYRYYNYRQEKNKQKLDIANKRIELLEMKQRILTNQIAKAAQKKGVDDVKPGADPAFIKSLLPAPVVMMNGSSGFTVPVTSAPDAVDASVDYANEGSVILKAKQAQSHYSHANLLNKFGALAHAPVDKPRVDAAELAAREERPSSSAAAAAA